MKQETVSDIFGEDPYATLVEEIKDFAIFLVDKQERVVSWNAGAQLVFGYSKTEIIGQSLAVLFTPEDRADGVPQRELNKAQSQGRAEDIRWHLRCDGTRFWANCVTTALRDAQGDLRGYVKLARDDTAHKLTEDKLRESEAHLRATLELSPQISWTATPDGDIEDFSDRWLQLAGLTRENALSEAGARSHPDELERMKADWMHSIQTGVTYDTEHRVLLADGAYHWMRSYAAPRRDEAGTIVRWHGTTENIDSRKQTEIALVKSRERKQMAMDAAGIFWWEIDLEARRVEWSSNHQAIVGFALPSDLDAVMERIHPQDREKIARFTEEGVRLGSSQLEFRLVAPDSGEATWMYARGGLAAKDPDGVQRFVGITQDITERKQAEEQLHTLADSIPQLTWIAEHDGTIFWYNQRWYEYTGTTPEAMQGWGWQSVHDPEVLPRVLERWRASIATGEMFEMEFPLRSSSGEFRTFLTRVTPLKDEEGRVLRWFGTNTDVDELRNAIRQAEEANRLKDEFLATLSHELRTPLTAILGWARILSMGALDAEDAARALETIERNARAQAQLIEDILDVSRVITGKLRLDVQPVDLTSIIEEAVETVLPSADAKGIRLQRVLDSGESLVSGDPTRLQQIAWNLLSNAVRFTPKNGRVQIRLERVNSHVEIVVEDSGQGIASEVLPHVFERFRQADSSSTRTHGGLGLGLAIVRHLAELHGGSVEAHSEGLEQGATFTVKLPLLVVRSPDAVRDEAEPRVHPTTSGDVGFRDAPDLTGLHVLVVDDQEDTRSLLTVVLRSCGARVSSADAALEALGMLVESRPDVLISDLGMPDEDGYSLIKRVRALPLESGGQTPAVALTAYARVEDRLRVLRAGFQLHVHKPVEPLELVTVVATLAGRLGE